MHLARPTGSRTTAMMPRPAMVISLALLVCQVSTLGLALLNHAGVGGQSGCWRGAAGGGGGVTLATFLAHPASDNTVASAANNTNVLISDSASFYFILLTCKKRWVCGAMIGDNLG